MSGRSIIAFAQIVFIVINMRITSQPKSTTYMQAFFFWTSEKKTQGKKTQALKKLKLIFPKTQANFPKTFKSANSLLT